MYLDYDNTIPHEDNLPVCMLLMFSSGSISRALHIPLIQTGGPLAFENVRATALVRWNGSTGTLWMMSSTLYMT